MTEKKSGSVLGAGSVLFLELLGYFHKCVHLVITH